MYFQYRLQTSNIYQYSHNNKLLFPEYISDVRWNSHILVHLEFLEIAFDSE